MEASKILEIINSVNMNDAERNTFGILTKWMNAHPDETTITTFEPAAALAWLARIAEHGAEDFYTGQIAARIAADMAAHGALLSVN